MDIYVANLLENDKDSLFSQFDVGIYTVELSSYTKGCSASITTPTFEVEFTAPALELRSMKPRFIGKYKLSPPPSLSLSLSLSLISVTDGITTVKLAESVYKVHVDVGNVLSSDLIEVTFLDEKFAIPITYTITPRESMLSVIGFFLVVEATVNTVEPLNNGHVGDEHFVHCSEVVPSSEVEMYGQYRQG